jgi:outer membrane receptor for monomeric catechols
MALGMGLSLNEKFSFNLGFKYDYIFPTTQQATVTDPNTGTGPTTTESETDPLHAASFLVGWSYQISDAVGMNLNFEVGATDDANDFSVRLGVPIRFNLFGTESE